MYFRNFSTLQMGENYEYTNGNWRWHVMIHNEYDLPDASTIHPMFGDSFGYSSLGALKFLLRAKHFSKSSTKSSPCNRQVFLILSEKEKYVGDLLLLLKWINSQT